MKKITEPEIIVTDEQLDDMVFGGNDIVSAAAAELRRSRVIIKQLTAALEERFSYNPSADMLSPSHDTLT